MAVSFLREAGIWGPLAVRCVSSKMLLGNGRHCPCQMQLLYHQQNIKQVVRTAASSTLRGDGKKAKNRADLTREAQVKLLDSDDLYRERYIPITRRSIIRLLMEDKNFLNSDEKKHFDDFALALDSAIVGRYHGILQELKMLFDPINPDKDTVQSRKYSRGERLDNEFWLLQRLQDIMDQANFHELEKSFIRKLLTEHESRAGVQVSINQDRYDVLRFWVLGREQPAPEPPFVIRLVNRIRGVQAKPSVEYYKRVVVAIRLKKDSKLMLKSFKEIPVNNLEMLLPDGTLKMNKLEKGIIATSVFFAMAGVVAKMVTVLASIELDWVLLVTLVMGGIGLRAWSSYKNHRNTYLVEVSRTLYFKNLANNQPLLAAIVDRAEDESFKKALLAYTFLLTSRPAAAKALAGSQHIYTELGDLSAADVERKVEKWIETKTGVRLEFDSLEPIQLLKSFGILKEANNKLYVLPLEAAHRCLPITPQSLIARSSEADLTEGYDRDEYLETEHEFKEQEKRSRRYGWF